MSDSTFMRISTVEWLQLNRENQRLTSQINTLTSELEDLRKELQTAQASIAPLQRPKLDLPLKTAQATDQGSPQAGGPVPPTPGKGAVLTPPPSEPSPLASAQLPSAPLSRADEPVSPLHAHNEPTPLEHLEAILDAHNVPKFELAPQAPDDATEAITRLIQQAPAPTQIQPTTQAQPSTDGQPPRLVAVPKTNMPYDSIWQSVATEPQHQVLLTPAAVRTAMIALELGQSRKGALSLIGVTKRRYQTYEQQARQGIEPYQTLFDLMDVAEARLELKLTDRWVGHTIDSWQAAKELLSRRRRDDWGDAPTINLSLTEMAKMNLEQLAEIIGPEALAFLQQQADDLLDNSYLALDPNNTFDGEVVPNRVLTGTGGI